MNYLKGYGVSLKNEHFEEILDQKPEAIDFLEVDVDDYLSGESIPLYYLDNIRHYYPISFHGRKTALGSFNDINIKHLTKIKKLIHDIEPEQYVEDLSFTYSHDFAPMPYSEESIEQFSKNLNKASDFLEIPIMLKNAPQFLDYSEEIMNEWEYLNKISEKTNSAIVLDIYAIFKNAKLRKIDPMLYIKSMSTKRVNELHFSFHNSNQKIELLENDPYWLLFQKTRKLFPESSILINWNDDIPNLPDMLEVMDYIIDFDNETLSKEKTKHIM